MSTDLAKLRAHLRTMQRQDIFAMLDHAVGLLPKAKLELLVKRYIHPSVVQRVFREVTARAAVGARLLASVTATASLDSAGSHHP